jgi:hypothetical protein
MNKHFSILKKYIDQPCEFNFTKQLTPVTPHPKQRFYMMVFDWENMEDENLKEDLHDEMGDEMFENENLVPFAIYNPVEHIELDEIQNIQGFNKAMDDNHYGYLMYDASTGKVVKCGMARSPLANSIKDLKIDIISLAGKQKK